ncbi:MAG: hypothetical protein ABI877_14025 [Gemmatimonadaceae bacterium]
MTGSEHTLHAVHIPRPFFESPPASGATRRLLLVSHAFPPDSTIGALRWEKMAAFAAQRGWSLDVLMIDPTQVEVRDDSRLTSLPPGIRLFGVHYYSYRESSMEAVLRQWAARVLRPLRSRESARESTRHQGKTPPIDAPAPPPASRGNGASEQASPGRFVLAVRRAQLARRSYAEWEDWAERATVMGIALAEERPYEVIVSSGPPHMSHEAARQISQATNTPYVIDLRDPWAHDEYQELDLQSPAWSRLSAHYEAKAVAGASLIVMNTELAAQMMRDQYPKAAEHIITVMNGADPELRLPGTWGSTFVISYAGQIYGGRDPRALFRGVGRAIHEVGIAPGELEVRFMGSDKIGSTPLTVSATESGLNGYFVSEPAQVRSAALALLQRSAMVVILPQKYWYSIPGKVFEYVQAQAWVLSLAERESATDLMLKDSGADIVAPDDTDGIAQVVAARYREFRSGVRPKPLNADGRFDRTRQADKLFQSIDRAIEQSTSTSRPRRFSSMIERLG